MFLRHSPPGVWHSRWFRRQFVFAGLHGAQIRRKPIFITSLNVSTSSSAGRKLSDDEAVAWAADNPDLDEIVLDDAYYEEIGMTREQAMRQQQELMYSVDPEAMPLDQMASVNEDLPEEWRKAIENLEVYGPQALLMAGFRAEEYAVARATLDSLDAHQVKVLPVSQEMLQLPLELAVQQQEIDWTSPRPPQWIMGGAWGSQRTLMFSEDSYYSDFEEAEVDEDEEAAEAPIALDEAKLRLLVQSAEQEGLDVARTLAEALAFGKGLCGLQALLPLSGNNADASLLNFRQLEAAFPGILAEIYYIQIQGTTAHNSSEEDLEPGDMSRTIGNRTVEQIVVWIGGDAPAANSSSGTPPGNPKVIIILSFRENNSFSQVVFPDKDLQLVIHANVKAAQYKQLSTNLTYTVHFAVTSSASAYKCEDIGPRQISRFSGMVVKGQAFSEAIHLDMGLAEFNDPDVFEYKSSKLTAQKIFPNRGNKPWTNDLEYCRRWKAYCFRDPELLLCACPLSAERQSSVSTATNGRRQEVFRISIESRGCCAELDYPNSRETTFEERYNMYTDLQGRGPEFRHICCIDVDSNNACVEGGEVIGILDAVRLKYGLRRASPESGGGDYQNMVERHTESPDASWSLDQLWGKL
eukprot:gene3320-3597_t